MITVEEYLMGRDKEYPLDYRQLRNMAELLSRVNFLLGKLGIEGRVSSGYRPSAMNKTIGGAKMSTHTMCAGVDIVGVELARHLHKNQSLLEECGLYLEHPDFTVGKTTGWTHLDIKKRNVRVFTP
jgi:hypothetical protein